MSRKSIIDKIMKLRAIAEHTNSDEIQAGIFAAKVAELLAKHDLEMTDLVEEQEGVTEYMWSTMYADPWRRAMWTAVCALYFCDIYGQRWWDKEAHTSRRGFKIVGRPEHIYVAREMCEYLEKTIMRLATNFARNHPDALYNHQKRKVHLTFERGAGERMAQRLHDLKKQREEGLKSTTVRGNPSNLPALYDNEALAVKEFMSQIDLKYRNRPRSRMSHSAFFDGAIAADEIRLDPQLEQAITPEIEDGVDDPGDAI